VLRVSPFGVAYETRFRTRTSGSAGSTAGAVDRVGAGIKHAWHASSVPHLHAAPGPGNAFDARAARVSQMVCPASHRPLALPVHVGGASDDGEPGLRGQSGSSGFCAQYSALSCLPQPATAAANHGDAV